MRCPATNRDGTPCKRETIRGSEFCISHTGTRGGAASKLTPEAQDRICLLLKTGASAETAAEAAGIAPRTLRLWMARGDPSRERKADAPYREFRAAVERAEVEVEAILVGRINQASAKGSWQAAAWLLERKWPDRYIRARAPAAEELPSQPPAASAPPREHAEVEMDTLDELAPRRLARAGTDE